LRSIHSQDLGGLDDFKTQGGQGIGRICETSSDRHKQFHQSSRFNSFAVF
jgi:hypothetical protein